MIQRYADDRITEIWSLENKYKLWQRVELAYLEAQTELGLVSESDYQRLKSTLLGTLINADEVARLEAELRHDLNAFVEERRAHLPVKLQALFHRGNTSYDTEEPAMALMLRMSYSVVMEEFEQLRNAVRNLAIDHRYTVMIGRTHGQEAELQSFGKRWCGYYQDLAVDARVLAETHDLLRMSKFSGAIGNYTTVTPELEELTLRNLELEPYIGATQIMPREVYAPLAFALAQLCQTVHKIALTIRLNSRSGLPLCHEPFGRGQMGSSAMPHKKNPIVTEQLEGMATMAKGYLAMLVDRIPTWEERAIEQSCVERVAWPDLFHVTVHALKQLRKVLTGLVVYPENMLLEVVQSGGLYASNAAKEWLKGVGAKQGLETEDAYRIIQLAAFNVADASRAYSVAASKSLEDVDAALREFTPKSGSRYLAFREIVIRHELATSPQLAADEETVRRWNTALALVFGETENQAAWSDLFLPSTILANEAQIYEVVGL